MSATASGVACSAAMMKSPSFSRSSSSRMITIRPERRSARISSTLANAVDGAPVSAELPEAPFEGPRGGREYTLDIEARPNGAPEGAEGEEDTGKGAHPRKTPPGGGVSSSGSMRNRPKTPVFRLTEELCDEDSLADSPHRQRWVVYVRSRA